jgi:hypothetical protein
MNFPIKFKKLLKINFIIYYEYIMNYSLRIVLYFLIRVIKYFKLKVVIV